jgi:hypothetical protein
LTGPSPVDRSRLGSKHHVICCGNGIPLALTVTAANRNDITQRCRRGGHSGARGGGGCAAV